MAVDFSRYAVPGVFSESVDGPQVGATSTAPRAIGLFGDSVRYRIDTETLTIPNDDSPSQIKTASDTLTFTKAADVSNPTDAETKTNVSNLDATVSTVVIKSSDGTVTYTPGVDYTVAYANSPAGTLQVSRLAGGRMWSAPSTTDNSETSAFSCIATYQYGGVGSPMATKNLRQNGINTSSVVVRNVSTNKVYTPDQDYSIVVSEGTDPTTQRDNVISIRRAKYGTLEANTVVQVSYQYTNSEYFDAHTFFDFDDVRDYYGPAFDTMGNIISPLTLAAQLAFMNGANTLVCVATDAANPLPTTQEYGEALDKLRNESEASIIVPITGDQTVHTLVKAHVTEQSANQAERRALLSRDGTVVNISTNNMITNANTIKDRRCALVAPAQVAFYNSQLNSTINIGGQYLAAAIAGISVRQNPAMPLTRKSLVGFVGLPKVYSQAEKAMMAQNGLMVVEQTREGTLRIMHGLTTDPSNILTKEWSLVGQQDALAWRIRDYLDNDQLIGNVITDLTLSNVKASADSALQALTQDQIIIGYSDLKVRQLEATPDVIEVRFAWKASVPLNYLVVRFSVDVTSGDISLSDQS